MRKKLHINIIKLILEIPDNDNILTPTNDLILNLMVPADATNYKPIISGLHLLYGLKIIPIPIRQV